jgi:hypothetical protein
MLDRRCTPVCGRLKCHEVRGTHKEVIMAADARKRQKKQERRARKRKEKKQVLVRREHITLADQLKAAAVHPILHCWVATTLWSDGLGPVLLSRRLPSGRVAIANLLVDRYCLGVKDAFAEIYGPSDYESFTRTMRASLPMRDIAPADARKLVERAVAYAGDLGFPPHRDYAVAALLLETIDATASTAEFEFGEDGRPCFVAGPNDTPGRCRQVLAILNDRCGPGEFRYVMPMGPSGSGAYLLNPEDEGDPELAEYDDDEVLGELEEFDDTRTESPGGKAS